MGVGGYVSVPQLWVEPADEAGVGDARAISEEEARWAQDPRLIVSLFLRDTQGILRTVARAVNQELVLDALVDQSPHPEGRVRLTIDGSLSSTVDDVFVVVLIVRAVGLNGAPVEGIDAEDLRGPVSRVVEQALEAEGLVPVIDRSPHGRGPGADEASPVAAFPFIVGDDGLFKGRVFSEYRFSVPGRSVDGARELGGIATRVSGVLRDHGVPIAYLFFPDRWSHGPDSQTLRIGLGAPQKWVDLLEVDVRVTAIARLAGCEFQKYNPYLDGPSMADRFGTIVARDRQDAGSEEEGIRSFDAVFVEAPARAGLVASMLEIVGPDVAGGTMTVLRGHTVACWLVPKGTGEAAHDKLEKLDPPAVANGQMRVIHQPAAQDGAAPVRRGRPIWIAWTNRDRPGVLSAILETVTAYVVELGGEPKDVDVKYAVSRVLADGSSCAGKMNLVICPELVGRLDISFTALLKGLEARIGQGCAPVGGRPDPSETFTVAEQEPGEEPWASLVVESNT